MAIINCTSTDPTDICNVFTGIGIGFGNFLAAIVTPLVYIIIVIGVVSAVIYLVMGIAKMLSGKLGVHTKYK